MEVAVVVVELLVLDEVKVVELLVLVLEDIEELDEAELVDVEANDALSRSTGFSSMVTEVPGATCWTTPLRFWY